MVQYRSLISAFLCLSVSQIALALSVEGESHRWSAVKEAHDELSASSSDHVSSSSSLDDHDRLIVAVYAFQNQRSP